MFFCGHRSYRVPYLLNVVCLDLHRSTYIACGQGLLNSQDAALIGTVLSKLVNNVKISAIITTSKLSSKRYLLILMLSIG